LTFNPEKFHELGLAKKSVMVIHNEILEAVLHLFWRNNFFWTTFLSCRFRKIN